MKIIELRDARTVGHFEEVPPPAQAPVCDTANALGLAVGLRAERANWGQWRCACCHKMQPNESWQVWVPDSVRKHDPIWSVTEAARENAYNGHLSAWCLKCAPKQPFVQRVFGASGEPCTPTSSAKRILLVALSVYVLAIVFVVVWF
jgi:hypothetical protein